MSDPIITVILTQVATILDQQIRKELRLVTGVTKDVKNLKREFESIKAVLADAEKQQTTKVAVKLWLERLKEVCYDTEDVLSEWITAIEKAKVDGLENGSSSTKKVRYFAKLPLVGFNKVVLRRDIAIKIKRINETLAAIATEKERYKFEEINERPPDRIKMTSFIPPQSVFEGRELDKISLTNKLLSPRDQGSALNIVSVIGLGGIGKTMLAQAVYRSHEIIDHFDLKMWVCVSEPFVDVRIAKAIVEDAVGFTPNMSELETIATKIRSCVTRQRFLLVLDDVSNGEYRKWEQILNSLSAGAAGSTILVTTKDERVSKSMRSSYELRLGELSCYDSWKLFERIAFLGKKREECEELKELGKMISDRCKGLPLTIKTIGGLLSSKKSVKEWEDVLHSEFWDWKEAGLFPPLMLSYYDLPADMKRCLSFCAVFPKDHVIDGRKLVWLWMAQGYISSTTDMEMEEIGHEYLKTLAMMSFFEVEETQRDPERILTIKMHDIVHDFAQYLSKNEISVLEVNDNIESSHKKARHLTLIRSEDAAFPKVTNMERLSTLWIQSFHDSPPILTRHDRVEDDFFSHLPRLRALDLSRNRIGWFAEEIGKLFQLKYLNLSHNPISELPASLCNLFNLQTLNLSGCNHLRELPQEIGKLINLRHLDIDHTDSLKILPKGVGKLGTTLQTLSKFVVARGRDKVEGICDLEDLNSLNNLRGCLKIERLGFVADANKAKTAQLHRKKYLSNVHLDFGTSSRSASQDEIVLEALQLHENVRSLEISSYRGTKLPSWIMKLTNLKKLHLRECHGFTTLPPLGRLPLVTLHLEDMDGITTLGPEFWGNETTINGEGIAAFAKLKMLKISKMGSWKEWVVMNSDENVSIMPNLRCLKILQCRQLEELPHRLLQKNTIGKLRVVGCPLLFQQYNKQDGQYRSIISRIPRVRVLN